MAGTVTYSGPACPSRDGAVQWANPLEFGLKNARVRPVEDGDRGDHLIVESTRSGAHYCIPREDYEKAGR